MSGSFSTTPPLTPSAIPWEGYRPWAATVLEARRDFVRIARSFWLIPELIPPVSRDDVALLYAFCRTLDDAVDEAPDAAAARAALAAWRAEVLGEAPARPLVAAFMHGFSRTGASAACVRLLLEGMEADLGTVRMADDDALLRYAYRVSSCVGLLLAPLLGVEGEEALYRVVDLGLGLQLSNVLLGVEADAAKGRVYLPGTRLAAAGLSFDDVLARPRDGRIAPVLEGLARLGDAYYRSASVGAATVPLRYRHGILLLGQAYAALGWRAARQEPSPATPHGLSTLERLAHLGALVRGGLHPRVLGFTPFPPHDAGLHRALAGLPGVHG